MSQRVNILLEDTVWQVLQRAPRGERSRIVNTALAQWFRQRRQQDAAERMDVLRQQLSSVSSDQLVAWVRADRQRDSGHDDDRSA